VLQKGMNNLIRTKNTTKGFTKAFVYFEFSIEQLAVNLLKNKHIPCAGSTNSHF